MRIMGVRVAARKLGSTAGDATKTVKLLDLLQKWLLP
jgi:hypothetical protein